MVFGCRVLRLSLRWYYSFLLKLLIRGTERGGRIIGFASFVETIKFTYASLYYWVLYCYNPAQLKRFDTVFLRAIPKIFKRPF